MSGLEWNCQPNLVLKNWRSRQIIIMIIIKDIYIAQVRKGHKCAMSAEMAVWLLTSH